jgi:hypothetical protein
VEKIMSKQVKTEVKKKRTLNINPVIRLFTLLALGALAYAGVMSLIKADPIVANVIAGVVVVLLVKETY